MNSNLLRANGQGNIEAWELVSFFCKILGTPSLDFFCQIVLLLFHCGQKRIYFLDFIKTTLT
jgi:hypothetical protein